MTPDPLGSAITTGPTAALWTDVALGPPVPGLLGARESALDAAAQAEPGQSAPPVGAGYLTGDMPPIAEAAVARGMAVVDPQGWNAYAYARNTPCTFSDASGYHFSLEACVWGSVWTGATGGALGGFFFGGPESLGATIAVGATIGAAVGALLAVGCVF
jgi:hypothetical protein